MQNTSSLFRSAGIFVVLLLLGGAVLYFMQERTYTYPLSNGESVASWDYQGAYEGNPELEQKTREEIMRLEKLIGVEGDDFTDYLVYVSLANQYNLLGDGAKEYANLNMALAIDSETTGLALYNMGVLLASLQAPQSARNAYAQAAQAQGQQIQYQSSYFEYLTENFASDTVAVENAYKEAYAIFGDNVTLLEIRARWLESVKRPQEAIDEWTKVKALSPAASAAIDLEIARLKAQL